MCENSTCMRVSRKRSAEITQKLYGKADHQLHMGKEIGSQLCILTDQSCYLSLDRCGSSLRTLFMGFGSLVSLPRSYKFHAQVGDIVNEHIDGKRLCSQINRFTLNH